MIYLRSSDIILLGNIILTFGFYLSLKFCWNQWRTRGIIKLDCHEGHLVSYLWTPFLAENSPNLQDVILMIVQIPIDSSNPVLTLHIYLADPLSTSYDRLDVFLSIYLDFSVRPSICVSSTTSAIAEKIWSFSVTFFTMLQHSESTLYRCYLRTRKRIPDPGTQNLTVGYRDS